MHSFIVSCVFLKNARLIRKNLRFGSLRDDDRSIERLIHSNLFKSHFFLHFVHLNSPLFHFPTLLTVYCSQRTDYPHNFSVCEKKNKHTSCSLKSHPSELAHPIQSNPIDRQRMKKRLMNSSSSHRRNDQHLQHSDSDLLAIKTETDRDCDHVYVHKTSKSSIENNHGYGYHPKKICLTETSLATSTSTSASVFIAHERDSRDYDAAKDLIDMCKTMSIKAQQFPLPPTTTTGASNGNYQGPMPMSMPMLNNGATFISQPLYHTNPPTSMSHTNYTTTSTCTTINPSTTSNYQSIIPRVASRSTEEYSEHSPVLHHPSVMDYNEGGVLSFNETTRNHQSIPVSVPMSVPVTPSIPPKVQVPACITRSSMKQKKSSVASSTTHTIQSLRKKKAVSSTKKITKVTAKKSKAQSKAKAKVKVMVNSRGKTKASGTSAKKESLPPAESITTKYYGSFSLYNKRDEDVLSPIHCFIRQYGIEAFVATEEDATDVEFYGARNFKIKPGLVCTRCKYCKHLPLKERSAKSMHYPSNMDCLYYSMENWLRYHSKDCEHIPLDIKEQMNEYIIESRSRAGGRYASMSCIFFVMIL